MLFENPSDLVPLSFWTSLNEAPSSGSGELDGATLVPFIFASGADTAPSLSTHRREDWIS